MLDSAIPFVQYLSPAQATEIEELLEGEIDEATLFARLGESLGASATGEDPEERGRVVFQRRIDELRTALCGNAVLKSYCGNPNTADTTSAAAAIAGGLVASNFSGINVILVAALVARIGLRAVCSGR